MDGWAVLQDDNIKLLFYDLLWITFQAGGVLSALWGKCFFVDFWLQSLVWPLDNMSTVYCQNTTSFLDFERTRQPVDCSFQSGVHQIFFPFALLKFIFLFRQVCAAIPLAEWIVSPSLLDLYHISIWERTTSMRRSFWRIFFFFFLKESASWRPFCM